MDILMFRALLIQTDQFMTMMIKEIPYICGLGVIGDIQSMDGIQIIALTLGGIAMVPLSITQMTFQKF